MSKNAPSEHKRNVHYGVVHQIVIEFLIRLDIVVKPNRNTCPPYEMFDKSRCHMQAS
jgi:hypothetical protein